MTSHEACEHYGNKCNCPYMGRPLREWLLVKTINPDQIRDVIGYPQMIRKDTSGFYDNEFHLGPLELHGCLDFWTAQYFNGGDIGRKVSLHLNQLTWTGVIEKVLSSSVLYQSEVRYKISLRPTIRPIHDSELQPKERVMNAIYEAVVVKVNEKGEPTDVIKVVPPYVAGSDRAAQDQVLVDYSVESGLTGKELTGISVRVRTFQGI